MQRSLSSIIAFGILAAIFMAVMSVYYLRQLPTQADLDSVEPAIRREHGIYLASTSPLTLKILPTQGDGDGVGVDVSCAFRPDIRKSSASVGLHLGRIARTVLNSPRLKGRIQYVTCRHAVDPALSRTVRAGERVDTARSNPAAPPAQKSPAAR